MRLIQEDKDLMIKYVGNYSNSYLYLYLYLYLYIYIYIYIYLDCNKLGIFTKQCPKKMRKTYIIRFCSSDESKQFCLFEGYFIANKKGI